jgi:hypothetical protein
MTNTTSKTTTYRRNFRGFWTRNGKPVADHQVPLKVRKLAYNMTPECSIECPRG